MGRPKALLPLPDGTPLIVAHLRAYAALGVPAVACLGAHLSLILPALPPGTPIWINLRWRDTDMLASAWPALRDAPGPVLLSPVDAPPPAPATLRALLAASGDAVPAAPDPARPGARTPGHPVRLEPPHPKIRLDHRLSRAQPIPVDDPGCALNLNTPAEWEAWLRSQLSQG